MLTSVNNPHTSGRHGHYAKWIVELPEHRRLIQVPGCGVFVIPFAFAVFDAVCAILFAIITLTRAPGPGTVQQTGNALHM